MGYAFPLSIDWHCLCGCSAASHATRATGEECHGACQHTPRNCRGFGYRPIEHTGRTPAITAIFTAAGSSEQRWPRHFTCDLSTDYQMLMRNDAPERFIWVLRESGTHLYRLDEQDAWQGGYVTAALRWLKENHPEALVYHWNGFDLTAVDYNTALALSAVPPLVSHPVSGRVGGASKREQLSDAARAELRARLGSTAEKFETPG